MIVRVRLFARQRELAGASRLELELPDGTSVAQAWTALAATYPALGPGRPYVRFARNGAYADETDELADGDELAFIPPVAGGDAPTSRVRWIAMTGDPIDDVALGRLRATVATSQDGAVVTFEGRTRESPGTPAPGEEAEAARHAGAGVLALEYEAYEEMALEVLGAIADEIEARFDVHRIAILHRTGRVPLEETSVAVVVAAPHRGAAFEACRYAIDELKGRAPIWKSEQFLDGSVWIGQPARLGAAAGPAEPGTPRREAAEPGIPRREAVDPDLDGAGDR